MKVRVAVIQAGSIVFDTASTLEKVKLLCAQAAVEGAELVVFPEAFLGGYPKGLDLGTRIGSRSPEGREDYRRYWAAAIEVPGQEAAILSEIAARHRTHLVIGVVERELGTLFCSVLFFGPNGEFQGKHRKLMPTGSERLLWGCGDGSTMPVVHTGFGIIGAAICWENYMPLFRAAMYAKGVSLWCAPTVDDRASWQATMQHVALEGRCFVLSACQYLLRTSCSHQTRETNQDTVLIKGGSVIVSPLGEILAGPLRECEGILSFEVDPDDTVRGKFDLDVVGHYSRPDIFALTVDENPKVAVEFRKLQASKAQPMPETSRI